MLKKTGVLRYDGNGLPICEICGQSFNRLACHVRQKHNLTAYDYKKKCGLDTSKGLCSARSAEKTRIKTLMHFEECIEKNLLKDGQKTRYKNGHSGRGKNKLSLQSEKRLINQIIIASKSAQGVERMRALGKSNIGNKKRWGKTNVSN